MQMLLDDLKIKLSLVIFGREMMIKLVNGIPEKLVEMDEQVTFVEQMNQDTGGPIMQINKFNVNPDEVDEFLKAFAATAEVLKRQPGYISAQLHRTIYRNLYAGYATFFIHLPVNEQAGQKIVVRRRIISHY